MRILKTVFLNILGAVVGLYVSELVFLITKWLFIDLLGKLDFLISLLSWPVDYETYAFTGIIVTVAFCSSYSCAFICKFSKSKLNYACLLLGLYNIVAYVASIIGSIAKNGFSLQALWMIIATIMTLGYFSLSAAANAEV